MFEIEETVPIEQPIERVWAFVMDEANDALWQTVSDRPRATVPHHAMTRVRWPARRVRWRGRTRRRREASP